MPGRHMTPQTERHRNDMKWSDPHFEVDGSVEHSIGISSWIDRRSFALTGAAVHSKAKGSAYSCFIIFANPEDIGR